MKRKGAKPDWQPSRRKFLQQTLQAATALSASAALIREPRAFAAAPVRNRRHLINIHNYGFFGGWDTFWFHNAVPHSELSGLTASAHLNSSNLLITDPSFRRAITGPDVFKAVKFSKRFVTDEGVASEGRRLNPSNWAGNLPTRHWAGPGMSAFTDSDFAAMCVWKGMTKEGDHGTGNQILLHGNSSTYSRSYSSLIGAAIAGSGYLLPLHFVEITDAPKVNLGMASGVEIPICIPDLGVFKTFTTASPAELQLPLRAFVNDAIKSLATTVSSSRFKLNAGRSLYSAFAGSFSGMLTVGGSNLATSFELLCLRKWYLLQVATAVKQMMSSSVSMSSWQPLMGYTAAQTGFAIPGTVRQNADTLKTYLTLKNQMRKVNPLLSDSDLEALKPLRDLQTSIQASGNPSDIDSVSDPFLVFIRSQAFSFAFADYLVRNELSAVVDLSINASDVHNINANGMFEHAVNFCCYKALMDSLRAYELPDGSGRSVFDVTTLAMSTEFDREPSFYAADSAYANNPGTNHGNSASILLAGGLIRGGTVVGAIRTGSMSEADYGNFDSGSMAFSYPVPINLDTGCTAAPGTPIANAVAEGALTTPSVSSVFVTLMAVYGAQIPPQQITSAPLVKAVLKG